MEKNRKDKKEIDKENNPFKTSKKENTPIDFTENLSKEEKMEAYKKKMVAYQKDMAKKKAFDKEYTDLQNKEQMESSKTINKYEKKVITYGILALIIVFLFTTYITNKDRFNIKKYMAQKEIEQKQKDYLPEEERIKEIEKRLRERKNEFTSFIMHQDKPTQFPEKFKVETFIKTLQADKLLVPEVDEIKDENIFMANSGKHFAVENFNNIFKDKYLTSKYKAEVKELQDIDEENPNILFIRKNGLYTNSGELVVNILDGKPQNFDGLVDLKANPIVIAYDKVDGDLTDKMIFKPELKDLKDGAIYTIQYTVTNSRGKTTTRELKIKCIDMMKNVKR